MCRVSAVARAAQTASVGGLDADARVLLVSTEGATAPGGCAAIVGRLPTGPCWKQRAGLGREALPEARLRIRESVT